MISEYSCAGRLATFSGALTHAGVTTTVQSEALTYDDDGNVTIDANDVTSQKECFEYSDGLDRLTRAYTTASRGCTLNPIDGPGPDPYNLTYTYNAIGNTTTVTDAGVPTTPTYNPSGPTSVRPHAMTGYGTTTLGYDANGALTTRTVGTAATTLTWDPLHTLATSIAPDSTVTTYVTDTAGNRLVKHNPDGTGTLYLDGMEITAPLTTGAAPTTATRYYGPATRIAGGADAGLWWQLANQQNSATVTANASTGAVRAQRYTPYGAHRNATSTLPIPRGFLDKTEDTSGYDDLGARLYDPAVGQFTRPDPLMNPTQPQTLNPYAYSGNNPTTLSDPSGLAAITGDGVGGSCHMTAANCEAPPPVPTLTPTPGAPAAGHSGPTPTPTPTVRSTPTPGPDDGSDPFSAVARAAGPAYHLYRKVMSYAPYGQQVGALLDHGTGCYNGNKGSCVGLFVDLVAVGIPAAGGFRGAAEAAEAVGGETVQLFRSVDAAEFDSVASTAKFSTVPGQMEGKFFATTGEHAEQWGQLLHGGDAITVETRIPKSLADQLFLREGKLDGVGPAIYANGEQLDLINLLLDGMRAWP